ncbi:MAG: thioredoxin domain-containing protein [Litorimonas sp.]
MMLTRTLRAVLLTVAGLGAAFAATAQAPGAADPYIFSEAPGDRAYGNPDADHTLIVYASNMCPHCGSWFTQQWPTVKRELVETGRLRFVFRPMPSGPMQMSMMGFIMAECAPDEDYMAVMEDQFARQATLLGLRDNDALRAQFAEIAAGAGLPDDAAISACLADPENQTALNVAGERARAAQIRGIPTFIFNGNIMGGDHDAEDVAAWMAAAE